MAQQHPYGHLRALLNEEEHQNGHHHESAWTYSPRNNGRNRWATIGALAVGLTLDTLIVFGAVKLFRRLVR